MKIIFPVIGIVVYASKRVISWFITILSLAYIKLSCDGVLTFSIMVGLTIIVNLSAVFLYDFFKTDVLGIETIKKGDVPDKRIPGIIKKIIKIGSSKKVLLFLIWNDPAIFMLFFRQGNDLYNGIPSKRQKLFFIISCLLTETLWGGVPLTLSYF